MKSVKMKTVSFVLYVFVVLCGAGIVVSEIAHAQDAKEHTVSDHVNGDVKKQTHSPSAENKTDPAAHDTDHKKNDPSSTHDEAGEHSDSHSAGGHIDLGALLPLWSCIPFACMLFSIALFPLLAPDFWHHHFGKVSAFWALSLAAPFLYVYKSIALHEILHIILADYVPFIILLWALYTVSGGILLRGSLRGTPLVMKHPDTCNRNGVGILDGYHRRGYVAYSSLFTRQ